MPKEKSANPVAAQHKADKRAALKKSKAQVATQRNERLAKRNPARLERQIADLQDLAKTQQLRPKDKATLEQLERDLKSVKRAREAAGESTPGSFRRDREEREARRDGRDGRDGHRGVKRRRSGSESTDPEVRDIPMPKDTPPPIPRRPKTEDEKAREEEERRKKELPAQTTYSSAPVVRDLKGEATRKFVPAAVAGNLARRKGVGDRLLEPEELERLENAEKERGREMERLKESAKIDASKAMEEKEAEAEFRAMLAGVEGGQTVGQERAAEKGLRTVEMEEVEDEDI